MWYKTAQSEALHINIPQSLSEILQVLKQKNMTPLIVGGAVRDAMLGYEPKDIDIEVYNTSYEDLENTLKVIPGSFVDSVGKSFGIVKFRTKEEEEFDFSVPRRDSKTGDGHKGFQIQTGADITPKEAAARRDFTINALAYDPFTGKILDFFGGIDDLKKKILRHTSGAFNEDPLRVLRGLQFSARFGFKIAPETAELAKTMIEEHSKISTERIEQEWHKLVTKGKTPGDAIQYLLDTGWADLYPEIKNMTGVPQEYEWHPENWSFTIVPLNSFITGSTQAKSINFLTRDLITQSITNSTLIKTSDITFDTKFMIKSGNTFSDLKTTNSTRISNFDFSPSINSPASITPSKGLVRFVSAAANQTDKIIRIMFKIPLTGMHAIMQPSINDLQVINGVIHSVSIYVMDMLTRQQFSSQKQLHDIPVNEHAAADARHTDFSISSGIMNPKFSIINNDIIFYFEFGLNSNVDIHNSDFNPENNAIYVILGDVGVHTSHVMNAAAQIADREGLQGDDRAVLVYAALAHDFAKAHTTELREKGGKMRWTAHGHEKAGGPLARAFLERIGVKKGIINKVVPLVENHLSHLSLEERFVPSLAHRISPATIHQLALLIEADHSGRPPLPQEMPHDARKMLEHAESHNVLHGPPKAFVQWQDLIAFGVDPNQSTPYDQNGVTKTVPLGRVLLDQAFNAQLKGHFFNKTEALAWLKKTVRPMVLLLKGNDPIFVNNNVTGAQLGKILNEAYEAQLQGAFKDIKGAYQWLSEKFNLK